MPKSPQRPPIKALYHIRIICPDYQDTSQGMVEHHLDMYKGFTSPLSAHTHTHTDTQTKSYAHMHTGAHMHQTNSPGYVLEMQFIPPHPIPPEGVLLLRRQAPLSR